MLRRVISLPVCLLLFAALAAAQAAQQPTPPSLPQAPLAPLPPNPSILGQGGFPGVPGQGGIPGAPAPRVPLQLPANAGPQELLPTAPPLRKATVLLSDELQHVPEVAFSAPLSHKLEAAKAREAIAQQMDKMRHANKQRPDAFVELLMKHRLDLAGLPFMMGDACRMKPELKEHFLQSAQSLRSQSAIVIPPAPPANFQRAGSPVSLNDDDDNHEAECSEAARVAAGWQVLLGDEKQQRLTLVRTLTAIPHPDASRDLAKLALFAPEQEIRRAAVHALRVRRERDYTSTLLAGFRYPHGPVAQRAADALVQLKRSDVLADLVAVLDEPDPRMPIARDEKGQKRYEVREMVKINHHRNCLLCHAPAAQSGAVNAENMAATVAVPSEPFPTAPYYGPTTVVSDFAIRFDVTYLRQDFSLLLPVADAAPWPSKQRFDFVVRTRVLDETEAAAYREALAQKPSGWLPPHHRAALLALRTLTERDAAPTAAAWRELLELPQRKQKTS